MRKFYIFFVLFILSATTLNARPLNLDQAVERVTTARTAQAKIHPALKKQKDPSQNIRTWDNLPIINWQQYQQLSQQTIQNREKQAKLGSQLRTSLLATKGYLEEEAELKVKQGLPIYEQAVKNFSYIYIGEYHDAPVIQQEITKLLKAIRKANPDKKILLATEFLQRSHPLMSPLHKDGQEWLIDDLSYDVSALADELHIDTLALEDNIIQIVDQVSLLKVGDRYIKVSLATNPQARSLIAPFKKEIKAHSRLLQMDPLGVMSRYLQPDQMENYIKKNELKEIDTAYSLAHAYGPDNVKYIEALLIPKLVPPTVQQANAVASATCLLNFIEASTWGILQRNYQWTKRIKQVEKNYDIVIVWGGNGHFDDDTLFPSVPALLNHPEAVMFDFQPIDIWDAIDEDSLLGDLKRTDKLLQQKLYSCESVAIDPEQMDKVVEECQLFESFDSVDLEQTYFAHVVYKKTVEELFDIFSPQQKALATQLKQLDPRIMNDSYKSLYMISLR